MIDIVSADDKGLRVFNTQTQRAANILSIQLGALEYAPDFGIDLRYFLTESIEFQDDSFKAYMIQALATRGINVASLVEVINALDANYNINLSPAENTTGLIAR